MMQDQISEATKKAIEIPLEFTHTMLEKSEKLRTPSPRVNKIGRTMGVCIGIGLLLLGTVQLFIGKPSWSIGTILVGGITIISNLICYHRNKKQN